MIEYDDIRSQLFLRSSVVSQNQNIQKGLNTSNYGIGFILPV